MGAEITRSWCQECARQHLVCIICVHRRQHHRFQVNFIPELTFEVLKVHLSHALDGVPVTEMKNFLLFSPEPRRNCINSSTFATEGVVPGALLILPIPTPSSSDNKIP
eukprot:TRINITY_DN5286_c0_g1_i5.p1 TRINITY_DN5286_c0_g1~~TRINITY_DN5286_c0_g1_i5.p1  ORF type:complete len:117 (-),score=12.10 TRINITY_DN5286_c0_g1_i5:84-407(-)